MKRVLIFFVGASLLIGYLFAGQSTSNDSKFLEEAVFDKVPPFSIKIKTAFLDITTTSTFDDWDIAKSLGPITQLKCWHGDVFNNIQAVYSMTSLPVHPSNVLLPQNTITIPADDPLIKVSGFYGIYFGATHITRVVFTLRSGKKFGPYGTGNNMTGLQRFTLGNRKKNGKLHTISAFFGGSYLHSDSSEFLSKFGIYRRLTIVS